MRLIRSILSLATAVVLGLCLSVTTIMAAELPSGSVQGLPEKLVVLDDEGISASETGEYYFEVEGMKVGETYVKKVQLMNLREDADYHMGLRFERMTTSGDFDLEEECMCEVLLDEKQVYSGKITGEGTPDIQDNALDLGLYRSGDSHRLEVRIRWAGTKAGGMIDNGRKVVDASGTTVEREASGVTELSGETTFKWIFTAKVELPQESTDIHESDPDTPDIINTGDTIAMVTIGIVCLATLFLIVLAVGKKKKKEARQK